MAPLGRMARARGYRRTENGLRRPALTLESEVVLKRSWHSQMKPGTGGEGWHRGGGALVHRGTGEQRLAQVEEVKGRLWKAGMG
ncbi:hypothetical protein NDU88_006327 [Pleurodeles waltl]|uniref:Uncharacterized protein n=1 Tax=Pleurodeles waltl TaxID=8319 RepID=A0AAV7LBT7_PLEWA|nr:hypothetical protein NDU88_006327 [Pleurodeles waltl]